MTKRFFFTIAMMGILTSVFARAEEAPCVGIYRTEHAKFFKAYANIKTEQANATVAAGAGGIVAYAVCIAATKSYFACAALLGGAAIVGLASGSEAQSSLRALEDSRRVYEIYTQAQTGLSEDSPEAKDLFLALDVSGQQRFEVLQKVSAMMTAGELCSGGKVSLSWEQLKSKLLAAQLKTEPTAN